ncbi:MAG TPA: diguanylate cyclase [Leptospiraceae bacterium]|nr:diguanylate cyclase [Leptospirales bacterium]HMY44118.1 diguanylate cyclase [Leptospiraceae bacterium]HNE23042.1 diguanylate cyclase [Leptospiraceae bacterium]HNL00248.1 diguanylate cyclase [Leptospiraceae bacterium]HNN58417.1 diguanylate cyclase [Leptospiraceae bacterium]
MGTVSSDDFSDRRRPKMESKQSDQRGAEEVHIPLEVVQQAGSGISGLLAASEVETTLLLLNAIADGVIGLNRSGMIIYANQSARGLLGYSSAELMGRRLDEFLIPPQSIEKILDPVLQGDVVSTDETILLSRKASTMDVIITGVPLIQHGQVSGALVIFRDITPGILLNRSLKEREEILRGIFYILPSGIMLMGQDGRIVRINEAARGLLSLGQAELRGEPYPATLWQAQDLDGNEIPIEEAPFQTALQSGLPVVGKVLRLGYHPNERFVLMSSSPLNVPGAPESRMVVTTVTDVNQQLKVQSRLETAVSLNNLLKNLLTETVPEETVDTALRGVCELMNADLALLGLLDDERKQITYDHILGFPEVFRGYTRPFSGSICEEMFARKMPVTIAKYSADPRRIDALVRAGAMTMLAAPILADQELIGSILMFRKVERPFESTDGESLMTLTPVLSAALYKATYERKLRELATSDPLTGIWNRRVVYEHLDMEIERCRRYGASLSILVLDLDHFKLVNDTYGHQAGDAVLITFSQLLRRLTRRTDMVGRSGGEEFMVILPDTSLQGALKTAEKIRVDFEHSPTQYRDLTIPATVSIGCTEYIRGESFEDFFGRVDRLLYRAKAAGRNQVVVDD